MTGPTPSMTTAAAYLLAFLWTVMSGGAPAFFAAQSIEQERDADVPAIVPLPQEVERSGGLLDLSTLRSIVLSRGAGESDRFAAELIQDELRVLDVDVSIDYEGPETSDSASIVIRPVGDTRPEGYRLEMTNIGARIEGADEAGRFYGAMSLIQVIRAEGPEVRTIRVNDYPDLTLRGITDDVSLQVPTLQEFKRFVRHLGELKMNVYAIPVEGIFRFEADRTAGMGTVSPEEFVELQELAAAYHVEIVPIFRTLGNLAPLLRLPEYARLAEYPGAGTPSVQDSASYAFLGTLLDEIVPVFRSPRLHIDGALYDEVGVGASAELVRKKGFVRVHLDHYRRIHDMVRDRGKEVLMRSDAIERDPAAEALLPDVTLVYVQDSGVFRSVADRTGGRSADRSVVSPFLRPEGRIFPDHVYTRDNVSRAAAQSGIAGLMARGWAAEGAPLLRAVQDREVAFAADAAWNAGPASETEHRVDVYYFGRDLPALRRLEESVRRLTGGVHHPHHWRHPIPRPVVDAEPPAEAAGSFHGATPSSERLLTEIESLQQDVPRNADWLDHYAFAARFATWTGETGRLAATVRGIGAGRGGPGAEKTAEWARRLASEARSLSQAFRLLWLRASREVNLDRVLREFTYQTAYLETVASALLSDSLDLPVKAPSRFILSADGGEASFLRKTFSLERGQVEDAYLQVAGRNDVEVWLNGDRVGRSVGPRWAAPEVWNVAPRLRSGENVLAVRAVRRGNAADGPAAANVYLEIHFMDGRVRRVTSDHTWRSSSEADDAWVDESFSDADWPYAVEAPTHPTLTAPLFDRGLPSRIEPGS